MAEKKNKNVENSSNGIEHRIEVPADQNFEVDNGQMKYVEIANNKQLEQDVMHALAKAIVTLNEKNERLKYYCEKNGWDDNVCFIIEEGLMQLGLANATLQVWDEDVTE